MENNQQEKKQSNAKFIIIIVLLLLTNATFVALWWMERGKKETVIVEKEQVIVERDNVKSDLLELQQEYATLQTNDVALQKELEEKRALIAELLEKAEKHKNDAYIISQLRKETETLRKIMKHYIVEIDSLNTLNKTIIAEKDKVSQDLNAEKEKTTQLSKDKESLQKTVNLGSILKAENPTSKGIKFKSGGKKEVETTKASRVERIKVSCVIGENKIAKQGNKTIYVRIVSPEGKEICKSQDDMNMVSFNGSKGYFAAKQDINYKNEEVSVDIFCANPSAFVPGKYLIEIIADEVVIGQSSLTLK